MELKTGDKVKFKNDKGEGVVRKIISDAEIYVEVEGIDIPYRK